MENIIIGARRNKGVITDEKTGKKTPFDSISIFTADFREQDALGFTFNMKGGNVVKIRTSEFYQVTGIKLKLFFENFEKKFNLHKVRVLCEKNKFGRDVVASVKISKKDCYTLWEEEQEALRELEAEDDDYDSLGDDNIDAIFAEETPEADFDEIDIDSIDTDTGEVQEAAPAPKKKSGESK